MYKTYSEWVQYFLNNGATLKLAEYMAMSKTRYETFDCTVCGSHNIVKKVPTEKIKSVSGLIDFIKNYADIEYEYNPCVKEDIPLINLDRVVELINEYCEKEK